MKKLIRLGLLPLVLSCVSLILPSSAALAQEEERQEAVEAPAVPAERRSARATMSTFLRAFDARHDVGLEESAIEPLARAAACLDLAEIPAQAREVRGKDLAVQLKAVLDRTLFVDFEAISDDPNAPPHVIEVEESGEIVLASSSRGEWLFTAETVAEIPELFAATEDRELVEGVSAGRQTVAAWLRSRVPSNLRQKGWILEHWQWLGLLTLALLGWLFDRLIVVLLELLAKRKLGVHLETVGAEELHSALRPVGLLAVALLWLAGLNALGLPGGLLAVLVVAGKFVAATSLVWAAYRMVDIFATLLGARAAESESKLDDLLVPFVRKIVKVFIIAFGLVFVADNLQVEVKSLLAGLGLGGLALALAAQDTVKNFFGSLTVLLEQPFHVGDAVKIGDVEGTVAEVGIRSTRIRTFYNSLVTLPNANLISAAVDNLGARAARRWKTTLSLTYDTPPDKIDAFCQGVRELLEEHPDVREGFVVHLNEFSASSLDVLLQCHFETRSWNVELQGRHRIALDILRLAERLGVELAFPTRTVHLKQEGGTGVETDEPGR